jgi:5-methylcytosine-specific restriction endonuclease McrA
MNKTIKPKTKKKAATKTPVSRITSALRRCWAWSPERRHVVKRANGHCEECGSKADKLEVHHVEPCDMTKLAKKVHAIMFPPPNALNAICVDCHNKIHGRKQK